MDDGRRDMMNLVEDSFRKRMAAQPALLNCTPDPCRRRLHQLVDKRLLLLPTEDTGRLEVAFLSKQEAETKKDKSMHPQVDIKLFPSLYIL